MPNSPEKKNLIINAAANLFQRYGYSKTSLEDIARDASLGKGTIYYYFSSKEDIFIEVVIKHAELFYETFVQELDKQTNFKDKFSAVIRYPIKLVYEHAPILVDAIKNISENSMLTLCSFREANRHRMEKILQNVIDYGRKQGEVSADIDSARFAQILFDWFLLGDSNIIIKYPEEFIRKAEQDYEMIVDILLNGILERGNNK